MENRTLPKLVKRNAERSSAVEFWNEKRQVLLESNLGVKAIFEQYKVFCQINDIPVLNEYIFRTYIRKHGYGKK